MIETHARVVGTHTPQGSLQNAYWWERLFKTIDASDVAGFIDFLTPDAQFRFGNAPVIQGVLKIGIAVAGFFGTIRSSQHRLIDSWCSTNESAGCEGEVTYTRHDGSVVTFPFANVFQLRGNKISSYRIYIDISTLLSGTS
jgi:ketosteroid isomerase-like protein